MLTILAWLVFVPAVAWNIIFFYVAFEALMSSNSEIEWTNKRNLRDLTISLIILFVPGVYLFGWF
jgi:hypothetical protein